MAKIKDSELKLIKELENEIGEKLPQISTGSILRSGKNGYAIDIAGNVIQLVLDRNKLKTIPTGSVQFEFIKGISFRWNQISDISLLSKVKQLTTLYLMNNQVSDISILTELKQLTTLYLYNNQISEISALAGLKQLTTLGLSSNQIYDISALAELRQLEALGLNDNQIRDISVLADLKQLTTLELRNNQITIFPKDMLNLNMEITMSSMTWLRADGINLYGNPLESPPLEIIRKGKDAIRDYYKSIKRGKELPLNEVKVLLVGDGGAGKTSLVKRLRKKRFNKKEPQTHGINIDLWSVSCGETDITTRLWDFGGQEIMHATHQFFLSKRSLYILVLDGRKDEKTEYWLKHIKSFGGDSPVLVVLNKIDENPGFEVNRKFLLAKYPNIKGFYRISCASGDGVENFSKALKKTIDSVEIKSTRWGEAWFNVKKKLENMRDDFIGYREYRKICEDAMVPDDSGRETLVEFLNDLGVIVHFKDFELKGTHILQPRWVTEAVYKIINSQQLADAKGVLDLEHLEDILKQKKKGDYYYPPEKYRFIIQLMKKFELCYELDDKRILVPDLLEKDQPDYEFDEKEALAFIVQYDFLPPSVMPRFIVKMHKDIHGCCQWRTGVVLSDTDYRSTAVVKADIDAKRIYFYVNGPQKRDYFAVLLTVLRRINGDFQKLKTIELIPLPDAPDLTAEYKQLIRNEEHGIPVYLPGDSDEVYNVKDLLGALRVKTLSEEGLLQILSKALPEDNNKASTLEKVNDTLLDAIKFHPRFLGLEFDFNAILKKLRTKKEK